MRACVQRAVARNSVRHACSTPGFHRICRISAVPHIQSRLLSTSQDFFDPDFSHRHTEIQLHPDSISKTIQPGNTIVRKGRDGSDKRRYTELVHGYFWMIKDLQRSDNKPILSNTKLIPAKQSKLFPKLDNLKSLSGDKSVNLPDYFVRKNRSRSVDAQCTVVGVSFRDFGYGLLSSWLDPFEKEYDGNDRVEVLRLSLSEGWVTKWFLRGFVQGFARRNTPKEYHSSTFLLFQTDMESFRDALRMHNLMTGYVFLLDGLGRVRFAGSGGAAEEESRRLIRMTRELLDSPEPIENSNKKKLGKKTMTTRSHITSQQRGGRPSRTQRRKMR